MAGYETKNKIGVALVKKNWYFKSLKRRNTSSFTRANIQFWTKWNNLLFGRL